MSDVQVSVSDGIAVVTLKAEHRRNALTPAMADELVSAVDEVDADDRVGGMVLTGGTAFCAGADLSTLAEVRDDPASDHNFLGIEGIYHAFLRVGRAEVATIAAVRGAAVGAGLNLALATDLRIVSRTARLLSGFARIGVHPGGGHSGLLARSGGREAAAAMGLFGCEIDGNRAAEIGMAWQAVDDVDVEPVAVELARRIGGDPSLARRMVASFRRQLGPPQLPWDVGVEVERGPQMWSFRRQT